eukprot:scaffold118334_cov19-Prasinocladus_malaysianus.AAC.1
MPLAFNDRSAVSQSVCIHVVYAWMIALTARIADEMHDFFSLVYMIPVSLCRDILPGPPSATT